MDSLLKDEKHMIQALDAHLREMTITGTKLLLNCQMYSSMIAMSALSDNYKACIEIEIVATNTFLPVVYRKDNYKEDILEGRRLFEDDVRANFGQEILDLVQKHIDDTINRLLNIPEKAKKEATRDMLDKMEPLNKGMLL